MKRMDLRLDKNLKGKNKRGKNSRSKNKSHATGGVGMSTHMQQDKDRLKQIIAERQDAYRDILGEFKPDALINKNRDKVGLLLNIVNCLTEEKKEFVIVPDVKTTLPAFQHMFKEKPFYVLSVDAPDVSFAFSEMTNNLTESLRIRVAHGKKVIGNLLEGGQHKAIDFNTQLQQTIETIQAKGFEKTRDIIDQLNEQGFKTRRGEDWTFANFYRAEKQIKKLQK